MFEVSLLGLFGFCISFRLFRVGGLNIPTSSMRVHSSALGRTFLQNSSLYSIAGPSMLSLGRYIASAGATPPSPPQSRSDVSSPSTSKQYKSATSAPPRNISTSTAATSGTDAEAENPDPLPILPRPLGVLKRPSTARTTWAEELMNPNSRMENRRVL